MHYYFNMHFFPQKETTDITDAINSTRSHLSRSSNMLVVCIDALYPTITSNHHAFIPLACAESNDSLPFSGGSSVPLCYILFPVTLLHQLFFHPLSPYLAICFFVYLPVFLFPNSYIIPFREFYFLPFSVHTQTNTIYLTLLSLL